jgi:protein-S-isoprenylcysteine O-methyltransferase
MNPSIFVRLIYALWIILIAYWTICAIGVKQETEGRWLQSVGLLLAIIIEFLLPTIFHFLRFGSVNPVASVARGIGVILCAAGAAQLVWARHLGRNCQTVAVKTGHEPVTPGRYRYLRHRMYAGGIVACIGSTIVCGGAWIFLLVKLDALFSCGEGQEDKLIARESPNEYPDYKRSKKALIPFVWK